jgi:hypothetical protein
MIICQFYDIYLLEDKNVKKIDYIFCIGVRLEVNQWSLDIEIPVY